MFAPAGTKAAGLTVVAQPVRACCEQRLQAVPCHGHAAVVSKLCLQHMSTVDGLQSSCPPQSDRFPGPSRPALPCPPGCHPLAVSCPCCQRLSCPSWRSLRGPQSPFLICSSTAGVSHDRVDPPKGGTYRIECACHPGQLTCSASIWSCQTIRHAHHFEACRDCRPP